MKKIFTFIAATLLAAGAYAQTLWAPNAETSVEANQTYIDDGLLTVKSTFAGTLKKSDATFGNLSFTHYIQVRAKADPTADVPEGTDNGGSTTLVFTPKKDVAVTIYYRRQSTTQTENKGTYAPNDGKDLKAFDQTNAAVIDGTLTILSETEDGKYGFATKEYSLKAGTSYTFWGRGTTINFYGIEYKTLTPVVDPNDYTSFIMNADLTGSDGWNIEGTKGYHNVGGVVTAGNNAVFDFCQTIKNLPAGKYKMTAQAAYRYSGSEADEAAAIAAGTDTKLATLYATVGAKTVSEKVMNRWDGASDTDYAEGNGSVSVNGKFVPNSTAAMKTWFDKGCYANELVFNVVEDADVTIGIEKSAQPEAGDYTVIGPWTLTRIGEADVIVTFDFSDPNFRENIGEAMTDTKGYIYNETFTAEGATLQITAGSAPSRIYVDNNRGQNLVTYTQYTTLTFRAPQGKAITKIEFTAAGNSNINKFTASSGTIEGMVWTGKADGVRFTQGGTSYLANAIVTLETTAESAALPAIEYTECANIAAFNALEAGTYAKVTLKDAEIIGKSADGYSTVWIQDATGGCWIQYTSLNDKLQEGTKVNGTVYTIQRLTSGNMQMKEAEDTPKSEITSEAINAYTIIEGTTIAGVNIPTNLNRLVKLSGVSIEVTKSNNTAQSGTLTLGDETITVNNGIATANQLLHKYDWTTVGEKFENVTIVAILSATSATATQLLPISIESTITDGISTVTANSSEVNIFNLQGQRMNSMQKGLYIVNGKKMMVK